MTNKSMLSVEREMIEEMLSAMKEVHSLPEKYYGSTLGDRVRTMLETQSDNLAIGTLHRGSDDKIIFNQSVEFHVKDGMKVYTDHCSRNSDQDYDALKAERDALLVKLGEAYEWGYGDGQNAPNSYSAKEDQDACIAELSAQAKQFDSAEPAAEGEGS